MSGDKARAINRAWEQWPSIDPEVVAGMVAAGWDACAAQPVSTPNEPKIVPPPAETISGPNDTHVTPTHFERLTQP